MEEGYLRFVLHSPFSTEDLQEGGKRALLLQFILSELLRASKMKGGTFTEPPRFFPFDWSRPIGPINRAMEHASLLERAFPQLANEAYLFHRELEQFAVKTSKSRLRGCLLQLLPFIQSCKENENLIYFLLKNQMKELLNSLYPEGIAQHTKVYCDQFHQRGFAAVIPEFKRLVTELEWTDG